MNIEKENGQELRLTLDLPASVNSIYGTNRFGAFYLKKHGRDYKTKMTKYIIKEVKKQGWTKTLENEFVYMDETIYFNRKGRDADNIKKLQQDCITDTDCVWSDDALCLPRTERIYIDKDSPRVEIVMTRAPFIGVFDNKAHYNKFVDKCKECKRYKNNCSILREITEGRIREEIDEDFNCSKLNPCKK